MLKTLLTIGCVAAMRIIEPFCTEVRMVNVKATIMRAQALNDFVITSQPKPVKPCFNSCLILGP